MITWTVEWKIIFLARLVNPKILEAVIPFQKSSFTFIFKSSLRFIFLTLADFNLFITNNDKLGNENNLLSSVHFGFIKIFRYGRTQIKIRIYYLAVCKIYPPVKLFRGKFRCPTVLLVGIAVQILYNIQQLFSNTPKMFWVLETNQQ